MPEDKLKKYHQKRSFTKTKEPKGKVPAYVKASSSAKASEDKSAGRQKSKDDKLIYVIQKHNASHLHYDLRLENDGVLLSWAIPKEPKMDKTKRLAVKTENHPVEYASFKGEIPEGEYGAGKVKIWDKGTWQPESIKKEKIVAVIKGRKLKGRFALVKFKNQPKNWLFLKVKEL